MNTFQFPYTITSFDLLQVFLQNDTSQRFFSVHNQICTTEYSLYSNEAVYPIRYCNTWSIILPARPVIHHQWFITSSSIWALRSDVLYDMGIEKELYMFLLEHRYYVPLPQITDEGIVAFLTSDIHPRVITT